MIQIWRWFVYQKRPLKERDHDGHSNWCFGLCGLGGKSCRRACPRAGSDGQDRNLAFAPAATTVRAGTKVLLVNRDDIPHLVVLANGKARSKALDTDDSFAFVFDKPGEFI
jgi:copper binding plastocyanin/azurin family protein